MLDLQSRHTIAAEYLCNLLKLMAPKDTGNLSANAIRLSQVGPNEWDIIIGGELAPYAIYTNEPWIDKRWGDKKNPNEGWIQNTIELAKPMIQTIMSGAVSAKDIELTLRTQETTFKKQLATIWSNPRTLARYNRLLEILSKKG